MSWTILPTISDTPPFDPATMRIDRVLEATSVAATQDPSGLGIANLLDVEFGPAQFGASDPVQIDANGLVTVNETGLYRVKLVLQFGRLGAGGVSHLLFRFLVGGVQIGRSISTRLDNTNTVAYLENDNWFNVPAGTTLQTQVMRDNAGNNTGGLIMTTPTDEGAGTWNNAPSALIRFERWLPL